jgi:glycosyltransferase involved in cell wall biosynthesis
VIEAPVEPAVGHNQARSLRVGLNLAFLAETSAGAGRYATELLPALLEAEPATRVTAFVTRDAPAGLFEHEWAPAVEWVRLPVRVIRKAHLVAQMSAIPVIAARRGLDVLHSPANGGPLFTPRVPRVVTVLDLIWLRQHEAWDTSFAVRSMAIFTRASARTAHRLIAISEAVRNDLVAMFGVEPAKIDVTPLGVRPPRGASEPEVEVRRRLGLGDAPIVLCVAQKRPYKNLGTLIRALASVDEQAPMLVLPGAPTAHEQELRAVAGEAGVAERVRFLHWVSESELEGLYRVSACFVLPSLIEGFGLPVLEAMARGVPVACSNRPALPEVVGDAALLFDPLDQAALAAALRRLLTDRQLGAELVRRGRARASEFTWRRTAELTLASYRRAIADHRGIRK